MVNPGRRRAQPFPFHLPRFNAQQRGATMSKKDRKKISDKCMERCRFESRNCSLKDDGTWDCSSRSDECFERCSIG
jgi:hypothetical protein